jgi:hypothetical protein
VQLRKAERKRQFLRLALMSPTGGGKTFTALRMAHAIAKRIDSRVAVIDTEEGSSELYAGAENPDGGVFEFGVIDLAREPAKFTVENYIKAIRTCAEAGIKVLVVDSASHAWAGEGGVLAFVDAKAGSNKFSGWRDATPLQQQFVRALLAYPGHVIVTMRVKTEWVLEKDDRGKQVPRRVGMQPVQRDGIEYEFTCVFDLEQETKRLTVGKTRCSALDGYSTTKAGAEVANALMDWLDSAPDQQAEGKALPTEPDGTKLDPAASLDPEARRRAKHHPTWAKSQPGFMAELTRLGMTYANVAALCESRGNGRPSWLDVKDLRDLLRWLRGEGSAVYFAAYPKADDGARGAA